MREPVLHCDFETRSVLDLKEVGLHRYVTHPDTDVWCMAWAIGDEDPHLWEPADGMKYEQHRVWSHVAHGGTVFAHNAAFELAVWNNIMVPRYGWPVLKPEQTYCTMAQAYAMGLPGALENAALALGLNLLKDTEGRALMLRMARPRRIENGKPIWWDEPDKLARLYAYCQQDVRVERALHARLLPLSDAERRVWLLDYKINQRGVAVDVETAKAAVAMSEVVKDRCNTELSKITQGAAQTVTALASFKEWMAAQGVPVESLAKQDVVDLLDTDLPPAVARALTLRQEAGKASTAKLDRVVASVGEDNRLRNMYQYHGAGTGRWAGRAVQTHNLPRDMPPPEQVERILALVRDGNYEAIDALYGPPLTMISKCLRSFFVAPEGKVLVGGDFANVEGRGQAWFAGEQWKIDAFLAADNKTGPGLYELTYSKAFNVPVESVKNPSEERQVGKTMELAFGYQGGVGSFHVMAKTYGVKVSDEKADEFKHAWRQAHPKITQVWYDIQKAAVNAVRNPGAVYACGYPGRQARFRTAGSFLWCLLPSGRAICYPYPKLLEGDFGPQLTYMTVPNEDTKRKGKIIHDPQNSASWARVATYGGSLFNNIVQGFSRDLLAHVMLELDAKGASIVLHTHDDCNIEVPEDKAETARAGMEQIMRTPPAWAAGFPLFAKCSIMRRYGK